MFSFVWKSLSHSSYSGDRWPKHWNKNRTTDANKQYESMSEEFYSWSQLPVIGPLQIEEWLRVVSNLGSSGSLHKPTIHLHEIFSGSGRLSLSGLMLTLRVGFPIDFRYGWDLSLPEHRKLIDKVDTFFDTHFCFYSPRCTRTPPQ